MILLTYLLLFRLYSTRAVPIATSFPEPLRHDSTLFTRDDSCPGRSVWDIIWSCLVTTFAVTWISVHPNVPCLNERRWSLLKRRIFLMCLSLLAPEVMIMWAFKQWRGAVKIMETINKSKPSQIEWTMTHAHFLQMGGMKICSERMKTKDQLATTDQPANDRRSKLSLGYSYEKCGINVWEGVMRFDDFAKSLIAGNIDLPDISVGEIEDRSKNDALSKGIALLQISWFIIQLIARARQHLAITEIELTTAALAGLNSVMYLFWWNKPFDVQSPIVIRAKDLAGPVFGEENASGTDEIETIEGQCPTAAVKWTFSLDEEGSLSPVEFNLGSHLIMTVRGCLDKVVSSVFRLVKIICMIDTTGTTGSNAGKPAIRRGFESIWICCKSVATKPFYLPRLFMFLPIDEILSGHVYPVEPPFSDAKHKMENSPALQLLFSELDMAWIMSMMFYSEKADRKPLLYFSALAGAAFGSVHCAAWHFQFPSPVEQAMWRAASLTIVGVCLFIIIEVPLYIAVRTRRFSALAAAKLRYDEDQRLPPDVRQGVKQPETDAKYRFWSKIRKYLQAAPAIIYPLARLTLIALALTSLRDLNESALQEVTWTKLIPHM